MIYELKKWFSGPVSRILLAVLAGLAVLASVFAAGGMTYVDESGTVHSGPGAARMMTEEKNRWKGELTPEVLEQVVWEAQKDRGQSRSYESEDPSSPESASYEDIQYMINGILSGDAGYSRDAIMELSPEEGRQLYSIREQRIARIIQAEAKSPLKREFLEKRYAEIKTPFYYEAADSWKTLFLYARIYILAAVAVIGFFAAGIFAGEFRLKADPIFFSSRNGRREAVRNKIKAGLLMATIVYWGGMLLLSALCLAAAGISGAAAPIQMGDAYNIYHITYGQLYLLILICGYAASLLSASSAMLTAAKSRSHIGAACVPLLLFCALPFMGLSTGFDILFSLTPDQLTNIDVCVGLPFLYELGGTVFRQIPFLPAFYGAISLAVLPLVYGIYSRYRMG